MPLYEVSRGTIQLSHYSLVTMLLLLLVVGAGLGAEQWPGSYWTIPGSYCAQRYPAGRCCAGAGRRDECGAPILNTTCYCDTFCNR